MIGGLLCLFGCINAMAEGSADTVVVFEKPEKVVLTDKNNIISVDVVGRNAGERLFIQKRVNPGNADTLVLRERSEWSISLPFAKKKKKNRRYYYFDGHWEGFGFGVCNAVNTATGGLNGPRGVKTTMGESYELFWNILSFDYSPWHNGFGFVSGIGIDWRNYRMTGRSRFVKNEDNLQIESYPEGADIKFSRIKVFSITVPFLVELQSTKRGHCFFSTGAIVNFNTYGSVKNRYKLDGKEIKEKFKNIHQTPLTVDFTAMAGFRGWGAYFKYSPCKVLDTEYGPEFKPLSVGLICFF